MPAEPSALGKNPGPWDLLFSIFFATALAVPEYHNQPLIYVNRVDQWADSKNGEYYVGGKGAGDVPWVFSISRYSDEEKHVCGSAVMRYENDQGAVEEQS